MQQGSSLLWCLLAGSGAQPLGLLPGAGRCPLCGVMVSWTHGVCTHTQPHRCPAAACAVWLCCTGGGMAARAGHRVLVALGGLGAAAWLCQGDASPTRSTSAPQHRCSECSSLPQMVSVQIRALCRTRAKHAPNLRRGVVRQRC